MSIAKVIERKKVISRNKNEAAARKEEIKGMFRNYVRSILPELEANFPHVTIGEGIGSEILGLSYSRSTTTMSRGKNVICSSTYNIVVAALSENFHIGYGANTASYKKLIPFSLDMTKVQLFRLFEQVVELLVSEAFSFHSDKEWRSKK